MSKNIKYLQKIQRFKKWTQPIINFLDRTRLLPLFVPIINWTLRKAKIKRQFQKDLNYRLIGKGFKNKLDPYNKNNPQKTILVPFLTGGNNIFLLINFLITHRLQKKGYQSVFLICDKSLPICNNERNLKTRKEDKHLCSNCYNPYSFLEKYTGARFLKISEYTNNQSIETELINIEKLATLDECRAYTFEGIEFGKIAEKSVLRFFLIGQLSNTEKHIKIYRRFLHSLIYFESAWKGALEKEKINPDLVLLYNGTLSFETYIREFCKKNSIDYVTHETYIGKNSWIYKKNNEVMKLNWDEHWESFKHQPLTSNQKEQAKNFIEGLRGGKEMYTKLNKETPLDNRLIGEEFVVLFTNLNFDTSVLGRNPVFDSMIDWINHVIDYWIENKITKKLVIRIHPAEAKLIKATSDFTGPKIEGKVKGHDNIILFNSADSVDSYTLIEHMQLGLIYGSTIGMEIAYMGKPCLVAGDAFYKNKEFVSNADNIDEYFAKIRKILEQPNLYIAQQKDVLHFIYFIYFKRVKRLNGIKMDHANHVNTFTFDNAEHLEEMNSELLDEFETEILN